MNTTNNTSKLVILGLMTGILLLMAYTPLGYLFSLDRSIR